MKTKVVASAAEALAERVKDGMTIAVGGFGLSGIPPNLIRALRDSGASDLTIVSNNMGVDGKGLGLVLENKQVSRVLASYVGENKLFARTVPRRVSGSGICSPGDPRRAAPRRRRRNPCLLHAHRRGHARGRG